MPDSDAMPYVYIIYSSNVQNLVERLVANLPDWGLPVSSAPQSLVYGSPAWMQAAEAAIKSAVAVLFIDSADMSEATLLIELVEIARRNNRPVHTVEVRSAQVQDRLSRAGEKTVSTTDEQYSALFHQIIAVFGVKSAPSMAAPESEIGGANQDEISANERPDWYTEALAQSGETSVGAPTESTSEVAQQQTQPDVLTAGDYPTWLSGLMTEDTEDDEEFADTSADQPIMPGDLPSWLTESTPDSSLDRGLDGMKNLSADSPAPPPPMPAPPIASPSPVMPVIAPPSLQPPQPPMPSKPAAPMPASPAPKPSNIAPTPIAAPGAAAKPSGGLSDQRGSGAANRDAGPSREESRRRSVDAPVSDRASKKSAPADDLMQTETETPESPKAKEAMPAVEDVHFTAFRPETVPVAQWLTLLVYAHADRARDLISADAEKFAEQMGGKPKAVQGKTAAQLERGTELRIVPTCDGVQFNPESISVKWIEDWHRAEFRFQAEAILSGTEDVARVAIYVGPLLVGQIKLALSFTPAQPARTPNLLNTITGRGNSKSRGKLKAASARMYEARQIFLSYSHADTNIVLACRDACKRLGFIPLIDIDTLRAGQHWNDELMNMIERADIFQLFWSERAAQSKYVQQEWEHALKLIKDNTKGTDFIRPTYWEKPPAPIPEALADIHFDYTPAVG